MPTNSTLAWESILYYSYLVTAKPSHYKHGIAQSQNTMLVCLEQSLRIKM